MTDTGEFQDAIHFNCVAPKVRRSCAMIEKPPREIHYLPKSSLRIFSSSADLSTFSSESLIQYLTPGLGTT